MVHIDTALGDELFNISITELVSEIPTNGGKNDVFGEMATSKFHGDTSQS